jgi:hypothetical protein
MFSLSFFFFIPPFRKSFAMLDHISKTFFSWYPQSFPLDQSSRIRVARLLKESMERLPTPDKVKLLFFMLHLLKLLKD